MSSGGGGQSWLRAPVRRRRGRRGGAAHLDCRPSRASRVCGAELWRRQGRDSGLKAETIPAGDLIAQSRAAWCLAKARGPTRRSHQWPHKAYERDTGK